MPFGSSIVAEIVPTYTFIESIKTLRAELRGSVGPVLKALAQATKKLGNDPLVLPDKDELFEGEKNTRIHRFLKGFAFTYKRIVYVEHGDVTRVQIVLNSAFHEEE